MATKQEIAAELNQLGVEYDPTAHVKTLEKLLNDTKAGVVTDPNAPQGSQEGDNSGNESDNSSANKNSPDASYDAAQVYTATKMPVRIYSLKEHGENFEDYAEEYCETHGGTYEMITLPPPPRPQSEIQAENEVNRRVILDGYGNVHRIYSLAEHGQDFAQLADEFIASHENMTIKQVK